MTAIDKFLNLKRMYNPKTGEEMPYKPLLLLAVLDLVEAGEVSAERIPWGAKVCERFAEYFSVIEKPGLKANVSDPFPRLQRDGIWEARDLVSGHVYTEKLAKRQFGEVEAVPSANVLALLQSADLRREARGILISRYFSEYRREFALEQWDYTQVPEIPLVAEQEEVYHKRKVSFRNEVVGEYDHQCAVCGLRIKIPLASSGSGAAGGRTLTFIDAAHLIPFAESYNDHPSNGMALCKNHHWAMDRRLIAPTPDGVWAVSEMVDARRSNGEAELRAVHGQGILLPANGRYHPSEEALRWRAERLLRA